MIRVLRLEVLFGMAVGVFATAKTPQQLRTEIAAILPAGQKARMIWSERATSSSFWTVYACDSDDGVIREITPASLFPAGARRSFPNALLSKDGQQIVLKDHVSDTIYVVDWNGRNFRVLLPYARLGHTWQDPSTGAQYVMATDLPQLGTWLVNLNNPSDRRKVWNEQLYDEGLGGTDGIGISVDGNRIGGFLCDTRSGIAATPSGTPVCGVCGGCNFAMRPVSGTAYEYSHFPDGHDQVCVHNADGSIKGLVDVASTVREWAARNVQIAYGEEPALMTWTNSPDYVTYQIGSWRVNPILFCVTTKKWVAMRDDLTSAVVNRFSVVLLPVSGGSVQDPRRTAAVITPTRGARDPGDEFSVLGRRMREMQGVRKAEVITVP